MKTRFSGIGGLVAVGAVVVGFGAGCDGLEPGDEAEGVETTSSALGNYGLPAKGSFQLHNYQTGLCLGVAAGNPNPGTKLVTWACDGSSNQNWQGADPSVYNAPIKNMVATNRCLDMQRGQYVTYTNGTPAIIDACDRPGAQAWRALPAGVDFTGQHQCYQFADQYGPTNKPLVLGVSGGNTAPGTAAIMWENFNDVYHHPDQYWCVY